MIGSTKEEVNNQIENDIYENSKEYVDHLQDYAYEFGKTKFDKLVDISTEENLKNFKENNIKTAHLDSFGKLIFNVNFKCIDSNEYKIKENDTIDDIEIIVGLPYKANLNFEEVKLFDRNTFGDKYNIHFENGELNITNNENNKLIFSSHTEHIQGIIQNIGNRGTVNCFINGNILSLQSNDLSINIDLKTEKELSLDDLIKLSNLDKNEVYSQIYSDINEHSKEEISNLEEVIELNSNDRKTLLDFEIQRNNLYFNQKGIKTAFLDNNGSLSFNTKFRNLDSNTVKKVLSSTQYITETHYETRDGVLVPIRTSKKVTIANINDKDDDYYKDQIIIGVPYTFEKSEIIKK